MYSLIINWLENKMEVGENGANYYFLQSFISTLEEKVIYL